MIDNLFLGTKSLRAKGGLTPAVLVLSVVVPAMSSAQPDPTPADVAVSMYVPGGEAMKYWPRWRGPSGQGVVEGSGYPDRWSDTDNVIWKVPVPGRGHSSPIVWRDRVFLTTAAHDGANRSVLCYRRSDGELLWETRLPDTIAESIQNKNSFATSTPSTDGQLVYAYFGNGGLVAVDFEGEVVWHVDLGTINLYHGPGGSPLLYEDRIILYQEQRAYPEAPTDPGFIVAIDKETGRELWRHERSRRPGWGTPIAVHVDDRVEIIVSSSRRIDGHDPETGEVRWFAEGNAVEVIPTPVTGHGMIYCSSGQSAPTIAVRPGGTGDVTDSHVVWRTTKGSPYVPSPLVLGDYLYTINDNSSVASSHDARTGELHRQIRLGQQQRNGFSASPVSVEGKLFFTNDDGETYVLNPAPDFELLHVNRLRERTLASPALVDGKWYFRTETHLFSIGIP